LGFGKDSKTAAQTGATFG